MSYKDIKTYSFKELESFKNKAFEEIQKFSIEVDSVKDTDFPFEDLCVEFGFELKETIVNFVSIANNLSDNVNDQFFKNLANSIYEKIDLIVEKTHSPSHLKTMNTKSILAEIKTSLDLINTETKNFKIDKDFYQIENSNDTSLIKIFSELNEREIDLKKITPQQKERLEKILNNTNKTKKTSLSENRIKKNRISI